MQMLGGFSVGRVPISSLLAGLCPDFSDNFQENGGAEANNLWPYRREQFCSDGAKEEKD